MAAGPSFSKYAKMQEDCFAVDVRVPKNAEFVITEKIHGANFCVIVRNEAVAFAKRTAILEDRDDFYSFRSCGLASTLTSLAHNILPSIQKLTTHPVEKESTIYIYGELCGGHYPHSDVPPVGMIQPVQRGIWYSPSLQFVAFDVAYSLHDGEELKYLDFDESKRVCDAHAISFVPVLGRGTLAECFDFTIRFVSVVSTRLFALPPLSESEINNAEGVVIRSAKEYGKSRALVKRKIPEFQESRYSNNDFQKSKNGGGGWGVSQDEVLKYEILSRITTQRVDSALSKVGRVEITDKQMCRALLNEFKSDVLESLEDSDREYLKGSAAMKAMLDQESKMFIAKYLRDLEKMKY